MGNLKINGYDQQLHENIMWERALDFYLQQNAILKTKLSQAIDDMDGKEFLGEAEHFQNIFLQNDERIKELQADIGQFERLLKDTKTDLNKLGIKNRKLNNEINNFENNFSNIKNTFWKYMESINR